ncbi:putative DEAD-box ATP-dependent RNA helicase 16-like [Capsicum annuum]|nr:putative DEAD-box ATP-dependent RNA helicase 16-like [Capsicum annuum]
MMSQKFGIAADNIIDAKLIDANGKIQDRESMGEDLFWAIRGGGGTSFGLIVSWKVKLLDIPEKVTMFNVERTLEQNATQLVYKWQHITDKVDDNLFLRLFVRSSESPFRCGQRTINAFFNTKFIGEVDELLHEMQKSFLELGLVKEDCIEMSWIESVVFFARNSGGAPIDVLLNLNTTTKTGSIFKGKSDYVQ